MLIGGLWHGAGWTFVIWGGLHGLYLMANHAWRMAGRKLPRLVAAAVTFLAVVIAWVFFRASDFTAAFSVLRPMAFANGLALPSAVGWVPRSPSRRWASISTVFSPIRSFRRGLRC